MSTKDKYLEAIQRADANDAARAAKKDRAQKRATLRAQASAPAQASVQSSPSLHSDQDVLASVPATAPQEEESQTKKMCLCHKEQNRLMDSHGCCKATIAVKIDKSQVQKSSDPCCPPHSAVNL